MRRVALFLSFLTFLSNEKIYVTSFLAHSSRQFHLCRQQLLPITATRSRTRHNRCSHLFVNNDKEEELEAEEEKVRVKILGDRRKQIRSSLKAAESLRNFRIEKGERRDSNIEPTFFEVELTFHILRYCIS